MDAFKLVISGSKVAVVNVNDSFAKGLKILNESGYSAIPVIDDDGAYVGTVCDKDFLEKYIDGEKSGSWETVNSESSCGVFEKFRAVGKSSPVENSIYKLRVGDIIKRDWNPAINISKDVNDVLLLSMEQNFVPVVDDLNRFIGIITRRDIIKFLSEKKEMAVQSPAMSYFENNDAGKMALAINQLQKNVEPYEMFTKMYEAAMKEIVIRIETINEMLKFKYNREPLHQIQTRIKSARSTLGKLAKKGLDATVDNMQQHLYDIAGVRVTCAYLNDVYEFASYIEDQEDLFVVRKKDYIKNPKPNGYRSLHLIVDVPVNYIGAMKVIPVEIQFRTEPMDYWASLEHDLKYKPTNNETGVDISKQLLECSEELAKTELKMQNLSELIAGKI